MRKIIYLVIIWSFISCTNEYTEIDNTYDEVKNAKEQLGRKLFFENTLSEPAGQSCATCHSPEAAFSDSNHHVVSPGVITSLFGNRNAPALAYNVFAPARFFAQDDNTFVGGMFLDGRANTLADQALGPLTNPAEMNNASLAVVAQKIRQLPYFSEIEKIYGASSTDNQVLNHFADAISFFERSKEVNSFTSKFDYVSRGLETFTNDEKKGLELFQGKAKCAQCHVTEEDERTGKVLFTDFTYDNLGVPKNNLNPFYNMPNNLNPDGVNFVDLGIGKIVNNTAHNGKFKVPSLRNIAKTAPYFHNGAMTTLKDVVHFYNKRDVENLGAPEVSQNKNTSELGNLQLTENEELQLVKFLETLTDHYKKN